MSAHQLHLFVSEADEALELAVELLDQMGHTGELDRIRFNHQMNRPLEALENHPSYKEARARRRARLWERLIRRAL